MARRKLGRPLHHRKDATSKGKMGITNLPPSYRRRYSESCSQQEPAGGRFCCLRNNPVQLFAVQCEVGQAARSTTWHFVDQFAGVSGSLREPDPRFWWSQLRSRGEHDFFPYPPAQGHTHSLCPPDGYPNAIPINQLVIRRHFKPARTDEAHVANAPCAVPSPRVWAESMIDCSRMPASSTLYSAQSLVGRR